MQITLRTELLKNWRSKVFSKINGFLLINFVQMIRGIEKKIEKKLWKYQEALRGA